MALWRVVSSTRIASRSPRRRGWARWSRPSASRAARTASRSSVLAVAARRAGRTVDLDDPFALLEQVGGEAGAVAAGALDRPDPTSWRLLDCEPVAAAVAGGVGRDALVRDDRTSRADQGNGVAVFVGVDADDVVDLVCQHGGAASFAGWRLSVPALARETAWQDCDGSRSTADRLLIRPTLRGARPAPGPQQTVQCQASPSGRQLRWESCRGTGADPDSDPSGPPGTNPEAPPARRSTTISVSLLPMTASQLESWRAVRQCPGSGGGLARHRCAGVPRWAGWAALDHHQADDQGEQREQDRELERGGDAVGQDLGGDLARELPGALELCPRGRRGAGQ